MTSIIPDHIRKLLSEYIFEVDPLCSSEDFSCTICHRLVLDAYQSFCGCKYCRECVFTYLNDGNTHCCGGKEDCQEEPLVIDININKSSLLDKKILKVRVHCPNELCEITSKLHDMEDHLRVCSQQSIECPYTSIGCENGEASKGAVDIHLARKSLTHSQLVVDAIDDLRNEVGGLKEDLQQCNLEIVRLNKISKEKEIMELTKLIEEEKNIRQHENESLTEQIIELRRKVEYAEDDRKRREVGDERPTYCDRSCERINGPMNQLQRPWLNMPPMLSNAYANVQPMANMISTQSLQNMAITYMFQGGLQHRNVMVDQMSARNMTVNPQTNHYHPQYGILGGYAAPPTNIMNQGIAERGIGGEDETSEAEVNQIDLDTPSKTDNTDSMKEKQLLGEKIYPLVNKHAGEMAGKITGMFLELDNAELLYMIENEESLRMKIDEAMAVLNVHKSEPVAHPQ